ncbi:MAG: hypothetical protein CVU05_10485, partial [Bacteroidetes bacterium HGW-Bacteroidetes-21]
MKKNFLFLLLGMIFSLFSLQAQPPGNALDLDGINDYVNFDNCPALKLRTTNYTIEFWVLPESTNNQLIFYHGLGCAYCPSWTMSIGPESTCNSPFGSTGKFTFQSGAGGSEVIQSGMVVPGHWVHVAVTFDGILIKMFINGKLEGQTEYYYLPSDNSACSMGFDPGCSGRYPFNGKIDEVRIWNSARSEAEILANMNNIVLPTSPGLQAYFRFDSPAGSAYAIDETGNGNDGTLFNMDVVNCWVESYAMVTPSMSVSNIEDYGFTLNWTAPTVGTVENYYLEIATDPDFNNKVSGYDPYKDMNLATTEVVTGLNPSTLYYTRVRAYKSSVGDVGGYHYSSPVIAHTNILPPGNAVEFNNSDHKVMVNMNINPTVVPALTASFWVKRTGSTSAFQSIISNDNGGFDRGVQVYTDGKYRIFAGRSIATGVPSKLGVWEHIAVYWSATEIKMFKNGKLVFTTTGETISSGATNFSLGNKANGSLPFIGVLDEVSLWNVQPTEAGLQATIYQPVNTAAAGLLAYYNCDEYSGIVLQDISGNGHDGTLTNMNDNSWVES